jgi:protein O-GlcNAc transferase
LLTHYDHSRLETFLYITSYAEDEVSAEIKAVVDHWRPAAALPPAVLANKIARDGIDILIDLAGHTAGNRLGVFAGRAAPIQMTWLGFFASSGLSNMDYRLSDAWMDPPEQTAAWHTERLLYLPAPFCYQVDSQSPPITALPAASNGYITFGALTHFNRVNAKVLDCWRSIFRDLPTARLRMFSGAADVDTATMADLAKKLNDIGLDASRVDILPWLDYPEFLDAVRSVDVALDSFPYPGGMTTMDALWMGVPTVTLVGQSSFERAGGSLLTLAGLPELIASTPAQYAEIAVGLAGKIDWLATTRADLRTRLALTPLIDGKAFATAFESVLRGVWIAELSILTAATVQ